MVRAVEQVTVARWMLGEGLGRARMEDVAGDSLKQWRGRAQDLAPVLFQGIQQPDRKTYPLRCILQGLYDHSPTSSSSSSSSSSSLQASHRRPFPQLAESEAFRTPLKIPSVESRLSVATESAVSAQYMAVVATAQSWREVDHANRN